MVVASAPAFYFLADIGVMKPAAFDIQQGNHARIDIVLVAGVRAVSDTVIGKLAIDDGDGAVRIGCAQKAFLVMRDIAVRQRQVASLVADAGAVGADAVWHLRTGEVEAGDVDIGVCDQDPLFVRQILGGFHRHPSTDRDEADLRADFSEIIGVDTGLHGHGITVRAGGDGRGDAGILLAGAHGEGGGTGGRCGAGEICGKGDRSAHKTSPF